MQKSPRIVEISTKVVGNTFLCSPCLYMPTASTYSVIVHSCNVHSCNFSHPVYIVHLKHHRMLLVALREVT